MDVEKTMRQYLPQVVHMSLATTKDGKPWVCEVHFAYDEDLNLYFRSLTSRRHSQEIATNPNVAGNMAIQCAIGEPCKGVVDFEGTATRLLPGPEQGKAFACIKERLGLGDEILEEAQREDGHQFYKITVDNWCVFGKFDGDKALKYELAWGKQADGK